MSNSFYNKIHNIVDNLKREPDEFMETDNAAYLTYNDNKNELGIVMFFDRVIIYEDNRFTEYLPFTNDVIDYLNILINNNAKR